MRTCGEHSGWDTASGLLVQAEGKAVHFETLKATPIIFKIPMLLSICPQMYVSSWMFCSLLILPWVAIYFPLSRYSYTLKDSVCLCVCVCVCVCVRERERGREIGLNNMDKCVILFAWLYYLIFTSFQEVKMHSRPQKRFQSFLGFSNPDSPGKGNWYRWL